MTANSRALYFFQCQVDFKFYTGQNNRRGNFSEAAIYWTEENAKKKLKELINGWVRQEFNLDYWLKQAPKESREEWQSEINARKNLPNWGIKIIKRTITV